jgi:tetratricopeptide (TPR) repeat protein
MAPIALLVLLAAYLSGLVRENRAVPSAALRTGVLGTGAALRRDAPPMSASDAARLESEKNVGLASLEEGDLPKARSRFETIRKLAPGEPLGWADGSIAALRAKNLAEAKTLIAEALRLAPSDARVLAIEGARAEGAGETAAAVAAYEKAAAADPKDLASRWSAARLLAAQPTERARARRALDAALEQSPENLFLLMRSLELARDAGDRATASAALERAAKSVENREARLDRAIAEARDALAAPSAPSSATDATVKTKILENLLRSSPRYQQARHDVEPGVIGIPLEDWSPALAAAVRRRPRAIPVRFVEKRLPGLASLKGVASVRVAGKDGRDLAFAGEGGLSIAAAADGYRAATVVPAAGSQGSARALAVADVTNSGALDLISPGGLFVSEKGAYRRMPVSIPAGEAVLPFDFDSDGDLDLYVSSSSGDRLLRNNLDGTWTDVTGTSGLPPGIASRAAVSADFDRDGDPDLVLVLARAGGGLALLDNLRGGRFAEKGAGATADGLPRSGSFLAVAAGDLNADGRPDLVWTTESAAFVALNRGDGTFLPAREIAAGGRPLLFDFDNDGALDLFLASPKGSSLWRNDGSGSFSRVEGAFPAAVDAEAVDVDADGDLDLVLVTPSGGVAVLENDGGNANGWIDVALEGLPTASAKVNRLGFGSEIEVRAGELYAFRTASRPVTRIGLGAVRRPDVLRVVWTNGVPQNVLSPPARTLVREVQQLKGSCPFVYAFDGVRGRWSFVTDALGRSPVGLLYDGVHQAAADTREWLVVPGEMLRPDSRGRLVLDFTEELWETAYLDMVSLAAVDHPAGTELVADEKMVPPPFPKKRLFSVERLRTPRATDETGRDRTEEIARLDGRHLAGFTPTRYQGIVAPHELVLELPEARRSTGPVMLWLTGWIFYADTSINVSLSQGHGLTAEGPELQVPDGKGGWRTAIPASSMGYPAGKTKTMRVDLSDVLDRNDPHPRVRIRTNLAIYWDRIAYTVGTVAADPRGRELPPPSASLSFRGFSRMTRETPDGPQVFVHDDVQTAPRWADMAGLYTRFGEVSELVTAADDRYVVLKGGDAVRLEFDASGLPPPPPGSVRDWLLVLDGWEKDADKNTVAGQMVEPLPFHGMDDARYGEPQSPADSEGFRKFREKWLTRREGPEAFVNSLSSKDGKR